MSDSSFDSATKNGWIWQGEVSGSGDLRSKFAALVTFTSHGLLKAAFSDGKNSLTSTMTDEDVRALADAPDIAKVDPSMVLQRIKNALLRTEEPAVRLARENGVPRFCISVPWGKEFTSCCVYVDIAAIPLKETSGSHPFLQMVSEMMQTSRAHADVLRARRADVELEIEDLSEAKKRLEVIASERSKRMQVYADTLNEYKGFCFEDQRKENNMVQNRT